MNQQTQTVDAQDSRREKRHVPTQTIMVYNTMTGQELGSLANITSDGLMLVSKADIETNRIYQISLQLPFAIEDSNSIDIVIDCLWSNTSESADLYWAGCAIIDADEAANSAIETLIESYSE